MDKRGGRQGWLGVPEGAPSFTSTISEDQVPTIRKAVQRHQNALMVGRAFVGLYLIDSIHFISELVLGRP